MTEREVAEHLNTRKGWHLIRCSRWTAVTLWAAGYAKVHVCGNAPDTFQMRLTGAGREWLR